MLRPYWSDCSIYFSLFAPSHKEQFAIDFFVIFSYNPAQEVLMRFGTFLKIAGFFSSVLAGAFWEMGFRGYAVAALVGAIGAIVLLLDLRQERVRLEEKLNKLTKENMEALNALRTHWSPKECARIRDGYCAEVERRFPEELLPLPPLPHEEAIKILRVRVSYEKEKARALCAAHKSIDGAILKWGVDQSQPFSFAGEGGRHYDGLRLANHWRHVAPHGDPQKLDALAKEIRSLRAHTPTGVEDRSCEH